MNLSLPKRDVLHALHLQWLMCRLSADWRTMTYNRRVYARQRHHERKRVVNEQIALRAGRGCVYDLDLDLLAFGRRLALRRFMKIYLLGALFLLPYWFMAGFIAFGLVNSIFGGGHFSGSHASQQLIVVAGGMIAHLGFTALLGFPFGCWSTLRLLRHAKRAARDPQYLLPRPRGL